LAVGSHLESIKLLLELIRFDLIIFISKQENKIIVFNES